MVTCESAEAIFYSGKIVTLDSNNTIASGVATKGGNILAVGSDGEIREVSNPSTKFVDLRGKTVLPGFIDSHCHLGRSATSFKYYVDGRCPPNKSIADMLERIRHRVKRTPEGESITVHCSMFGGNHSLRWLCAYSRSLARRTVRTKVFAGKRR